MDWLGRKVLVTGGCSFIGSHLVDKLVELGADVRVVDDLSSGRVENIQKHVEEKRIEFIHGNLLRQDVAKQVVAGMSIVFHLAADHGGRGYVDSHQANCATNVTLDGLVFLACKDANVDKIVYASSGCVYPNFRQSNPDELLYLTEGMSGPCYDADNMYGWAKLIGEMTLQAYSRDWGMKTVSCRYFTAYGERAVENLAVIAMIGRAFIKQDPFIVWGTGEQIRNWTYVSDIVDGTILAAEKIDDGTPVNLGTTERIRVIDAVKEVLQYTGHDAIIQFQPHMPVGPMNRVSDISLAKKLLDWEPQVQFIDGLHRTIDWYFRAKDHEKVQRTLDYALIERSIQL